MKIENIPAYEQILEQEIPDIHAKGSLWKHKKSGARVMVLETEDENKVFKIVFIASIIFVVIFELFSI